MKIIHPVGEIIRQSSVKLFSGMGDNPCCDRSKERIENDACLATRSPHEERRRFRLVTFAGDDDKTLSDDILVVEFKSSQFL